ncbi:MAG: bifunctional acetate--CoA ligase family protein/GNAT family N-acetyltransferase [Candidatus Eisenbacteria bacterium]|nr:bifunctional acetate--CoA ligase family protein/GNAT family N-acetyltransferase [Candidatus Eisenbacteria bacterium]
MNVHKLDPIFRPKRIAVVGVTENPMSVGGTVLRNLVGTGFRGVVYPVSAGAEAVQGIPCYPDLDALPKTPDLALIAAPAEQAPEWVRRAGERGVRGVIVLSAGFGEAGPEGKALEEELRLAAAAFPEMRMIGPNCLGIIVPELSLNATFAKGMPKEGKVAFVSQSGALCTSVLDWAIRENIGFSYFVSVGNMLDVEFGDLIDYFGEDEKTESIILYIESIKDARRFMTAARAFARTKPIVAYKAGRFPESAAAAASHTGALAAEDSVYDAAFERAGVARVFEIGEIFDVAELVGKHKVPAGPRLAIVTNAGGPGVMATDALLALDGRLAGLAGETMEKLNRALPPMWSRRNPVDVLGDARSKRYKKALEIVLADPGVDAALVILTPQAMTDPVRTARATAELSAESRKPILAAWLGGASMTEGIDILNRAGVATYSTPEQAVRAFMTLVGYARNLEILYETPRAIPVTFTVDRARIRERFESLLRGGETLGETASKTLLDAYGIPVSAPENAADPDEAAATAARIGYPVVLKILSPDITHKTDVGGVALGLRNEEDLRGAFDRLVRNAREKRPDARIEGVTVQRMFERGDGVEMILGLKRDPVFGSVILAGLGGVSAELFADRALGFPPLTERLARRMLEKLKAWPLLNGYRGRPKANTDRLIEVMLRLSYLAADFPEISELDVNPLLVTPEDAVALDARVILGAAAAPPDREYRHLALRPYPEEYVRTARLPEGAETTLRPIKPEDEPLWMEMLGSCSQESIYARFRYAFHWKSHDVAVRYCFIDYAREVAIVAEMEEEGGRRLAGVGRLIADPDGETVEYAILVTDAWQNRGLGALLTDHCLEIARSWGMRRMVAQTTSDNDRMIALFRKRGFAVRVDPESSLVEVSLDLG